MSGRRAKLEALLARVGQRAQEPRLAVGANAAPAAAPLGPMAAAASIARNSTAQELTGGASDSAPPPESSAQAIALEPVATDALGAPQAPSAVPPELELDEPGGSVLPPPPESAQPDSLDDILVEEDDSELVSSELLASPSSREAPTAPGLRGGPGPTMEQVGATVPLEEGDDGTLDLDEPSPGAIMPSSRPGRLEADLVPDGAAQLKSAQSAMQDLQRMRLGEMTPIEARVSTRPLASTNVLDFVEATKSFAPKSFLELLDASLSLK